jgi:hypothetical protein
LTLDPLSPIFPPLRSVFEHFHVKYKQEKPMADGESPDRHTHKRGGNPGMFSGFYGLAFIGAAVYFVGHATSFWGGVLGFLKALVWPAFVIYRALELMGM